MKNMKKISSFALSLVFGLMVAACGSSDSTNTEAVCAAEDTLACECADGASGEQFCKADGSGYEACSCSGDSINGGLLTKGRWSGSAESAWGLCFFVNEAGNKLIADKSCNGDDLNSTANELGAAVGADVISGTSTPSDDTCSFKFNYLEDISISSDGTFKIEDYKPEGESNTYNIVGRFTQTSAVGTVSSNNVSPGANWTKCEINWTASPD